MPLEDFNKFFLTNPDERKKVNKTVRSKEDELLMNLAPCLYTKWRYTNKVASSKELLHLQKSQPELMTVKNKEVFSSLNSPY